MLEDLWRKLKINWITLYIYRDFFRIKKYFSRRCDIGRPWQSERDGRVGRKRDGGGGGKINIPLWKSVESLELNYRILSERPWEPAISVDMSLRSTDHSHDSVRQGEKKTPPIFLMINVFARALDNSQISCPGIYDFIALICALNITYILFYFYQD